MANRKKEILDAYIELSYINRNTGKKASAQMVADYIGCSKVLIFQYYPNVRSLSDNCFDLICHEIKEEIKAVSVPDVIETGTIFSYLCEIWRTFFSYLVSHLAKMHFFIFYSLNYSRFPSGYISSDAVARSILGDRYEQFILKCPDFMLISEYLITVAALAANIVQNSKNPQLVTEKISVIIMNGISAMIEQEKHDQKVND